MRASHTPAMLQQVLAAPSPRVVSLSLDRPFCARRPPHPGRSIKDACLDAVGLKVTEGARVLGVARHTLSRVLNGRSGLSPEMAIRLHKPG